MKKSTCFIVTAFVTGCQFLAAQSAKEDTIARRNVVIERDYIPTIQDVQKIDVAPLLTEPEIKKEAVNYSDQLSLLQPDYEMNKWQAAAIHLDQNNPKKGYALLGLGFYGTALGDLFYPIVDNAKQSLTFDTHILGIFGNKQQKLTTNFGLDYSHQFDNFNINLGAYFKRTGFNYYGINGLNFNKYTATYKDSTNNFINFGVKAGIHSKGNAEDVHYSADIQYNNFTPGTGLGEQQIHTLGNIELPIEQYHIGLDLDMYNLTYAQYQGATLFPSQSVVGVNPYLGISGDEWKVRIGLKDYFSTGGNGKACNFAPDITGQINIIKTVTAYAGITGQYTVNTMQRITDENLYIDPTVRVNDSYAPFEFYGGLKFSPITGLLINGSVDYTLFNKEYFYVNESEPENTYLAYQNNSALYVPNNSPSYLTRPMYNVVYDKAKLLKTILKASYDWQDRVITHFSTQFNNWDMNTLEHAWMRPSFEMELGSEVKVNKNIFLNANYYFAGGRYAQIGTFSSAVTTPSTVHMDNINDLSLGASYLYSDWLTTFIRLNNVLGKSYQTWYGYDTLGINWQIGAAIIF